MQKRILGIDAGSVSVSVVEIAQDGQLLDEIYVSHFGKPASCLHNILSKKDLSGLVGVARTSTAPNLIANTKTYDSRIAMIAGSKSRFPSARSILHVGGEKFSLIRFDQNNNYQSLRSNTSCAAGTGGFLDQQAKRLSLKDSAELSKKALSNKGETPKIASRCSVFAKTDIIHRQQEGYSLEEICDGLCRGLANNIADTLNLGDAGLSPMVFTGGVAQNQAVVKHLENITASDILVHKHAHLFSAIGAAQLLLDDPDFKKLSFTSSDLLVVPSEEKKYFYEPLELKLSDYPDFDGLEHYDFPVSTGGTPVEIDIYQFPGKNASSEVYMGLDIGSTSTKAIIIDKDFTPVAGFYTRTAGRPIIATQGVFEAINHVSQKYTHRFNFISVATTGSGRKFIGKLIGADCIMDEISAHARAAVDLDPDIDTIIEIGGQDAKFTSLRKGVVTFSKMNNVCAAGTGSFIEEQAQKLNVSLSEYSSLAKGAQAPLASDRCTVFMERDINHYLNKNYSVNEILATALYSVRENYLQKVASGGTIGKRVFFQGATAKNMALVAAFEQKLQQPVFVSRYCHLTGALGAAITTAEEMQEKSTFKGIDIYKKQIPIRTETCELCLNHCRIRIASIKDDEVAYGFLCGRDYHTKKYVKKEKVPSLLQIRKKAIPKNTFKEISESAPVIGIPAGLQIFEELSLWEHFFNSLGMKTISSENEKNILEIGKKHSGAEFCAPVTAFHGHVQVLIPHCDILFLPIHLESSKDPDNPERMRKYCYYTQFTSIVASLTKKNNVRINSMRPIINHRQNPLLTKAELHRSLQKAFPGQCSILAINKAYDDAWAHYMEKKEKMKALYTPPKDSEIKIALLGRPYTVLSNSMNKGIPNYFAQLGIETFFNDSLPTAAKDADMELLLDQFHWAYPAAILEAADMCTKTSGLYPVFITSFMCAPDSFALEYFKRIMDAHEKPYLILQLDEHDSNVGYETRIEAGVRAFQNHLRSSVPEKIPEKKYAITSKMEKDYKGKTILLPNWDPTVIPLVAANLRAAGIDARVLEETPQLIAESMKMNTGQCIPVNAIAHEFITYVKKYALVPADTLLWMIEGKWACNIRLYAPYIKTLINESGDNLEGADIYIGTIAMFDFSAIISVKTYFAYMFGGNLKKIGCMIRPYEVEKGKTDRILKQCHNIFLDAFLGKIKYLDAVERVIAKIDTVEINKTAKPKVAIFGDLYVRDNEVMNQDLIRVIEDTGGEVLVTPYHDYAKITFGALAKKWIKQLNVSDLIIYRSLLAAMQLFENRYQSRFSKYVGEAVSPSNPDAEKELAQFNIRIEQEGESYENVLKIFRIMKEHPDISLFVQTNPSFCCPSLITEAMSKDIEEITGVPVLTITYDGTETQKNDIIIPYLKYAKIGESAERT
ncbi:MAG: CoA activase [Candidatus Marinimicrobia bacterium]|nr:CoA activase [Candidatus Neomarinimicrobiota bacterium]